MIKAFYTGTTAVKEYQKMLDVTANNLSNANTDGYKTARLTFQELFYKRMRMPDDYEARSGRYDAVTLRNKEISIFAHEQNGAWREANGEAISAMLENNYFTENKLRAGSGSRATELALVMRNGSFYETGDPLSVAIEGDGFFAVEGYYGEVYYTKSGAFRVSNEEDGMYLVSAGGEYVLDGNLNRIMLKTDPSNTKITAYYNGLIEEENEISIGLFSCSNIYGLALAGNDRYVPTDFSGAMELVEDGSINIEQGHLEMSNVSLAEEMTRLIQSQRSFQANLTIIRTADEIAEYTNQLKS